LDALCLILIACVVQSIGLTYGNTLHMKQLFLELLIITNRPEPAYNGLMSCSLQFSGNENTYLFIAHCKSLILSRQLIHKTVIGPMQFHNIGICLFLLPLCPIVLGAGNESHLGAAVHTNTRELAL